MKMAVLTIVLLFAAVPLFAETYTWVDDQGTVNFTEDRGNVPARYRKKAKVVGEVELPPAEAPQGGEKPAVKGKGEAVSQPGLQGKKKAVYGGKESDAWKREFAALDADVKAAEKQLVETRNLLKDTSSMSRSEYLSIQSTLRSLENSVLVRRQKLEDLRKNADAAGVPEDLLE